MAKRLLGPLLALGLWLGSPALALAAAATPVAPCVTIVNSSSGVAIEGCQPVTPSFPLPVTGSFSSTIAGFAPGGAYSTPLSVSAVSSRVALPAGTTVVVYNTGANAAYVTLGNASVVATTSDDVIQPNSWLAFTPGTNVDLAAITSTSTTSLNISGGSGIATGAGGGGSGGGGGGSVTQGTTPWVDSITQWNNVALGSPSAYGTSPGAVTVPGVNAFVTNTIPVTGTFFQATQPVSATSLPLPTGASTGALQTSTQGTVAAGTAATTSTLSGCVFNTSLPGPTNGQQVGTQCDNSGKEYVVLGSNAGANAATSHGVTGALAASLVLKASAGNLYSYNCTAIAGGVAGYCVAVNLTAAPGAGAITPLDFCYFPAGAAGCSLGHAPLPIAYSTGITVLVSSATSPYIYTTGVLTAAISGDYQ